MTNNMHGVENISETSGVSFSTLFCFSTSHSVSVGLQDRGQYDVAARHGVSPWKQGILCALLAAWDIFVDSHTLVLSAGLAGPEIVLDRSYVARARSLHKVLETLRDAWIDDPLHAPSQIFADTDPAAGLHGDPVRSDMPPFPATQLGFPKAPPADAQEAPPLEAQGEDALEDASAAVPLSLPPFQFPAEPSTGDLPEVKTIDTCCKLKQRPLFTDREIVQVTVALGKPEVTWPMVQGRLRKVVEQDDGAKVRSGATKKQWETVMTAAVRKYPVASIQTGKDFKVLFFAPPSAADGRYRMVCYHNMLMDCCCVSARTFRQKLAVDAQQVGAQGSRKRQRS